MIIYSGKEIPGDFNMIRNTNASTPEQQGIRISLVGALTFAVLGLSFAIWSESQAVLLDGAFNLITALMVLFAMRISRLLGEPGSQRRPVGYVALEPLYILIKGLILLILTLFVMASNVIIMLRGGNELKLGIIVIYIGIAVIGNFITWLLIHQKNKNFPSPLLEVEKQNWLVNAMISSGIGVSFILVLIFRDGAMKPLVPYVDQIVVLVVGLISLPVPIGAIRNGLRDLLLFGAGESVQQKAEDIISHHLPSSEINEWKVYVLKTGRKYWLSLFVNPAGDTIASDFSDKLHAVLVTALEEEYSPCNLDIVISRQEDYQR
jgi:predicted Co/Zn/Cd cation transporter (cation efflux family)